MLKFSTVTVANKRPYTLRVNMEIIKYGNILTAPGFRPKHQDKIRNNCKEMIKLHVNRHPSARNISTNTTKAK